MLSLSAQVEGLRVEAALPPFVRVRQHFEVERVTDFEGDTAAAVQVFAGRVQPGMRIGVGVGSRGIANLPRIVRAVGAELRRRGADPYVLPAMGSHGGATAEGQTELLAELGVTEASVGMPIQSSLAVREVGRLDGETMICWSADALDADGVVLVNRVKPHTDFRAPVESGLAKMCVIGLGKQYGAQLVHAYGVLEGLAQLMPQAARLILGLGKVIGGVAILENAYDETARIEGVAAEGIAGAHEQALQAQAKAMMPSIPFDRLDTLIIDEMGKNISGAGMDPNIIGRMLIFGVPDLPRPQVATIAVLGLTEHSHGNAAGVGLADFTTRRLFESISFEHMYINGLTAGIGGVQRCRVPIVMPTDRDAIHAAVRTSGCADTRRARIVRIPNTLQIGEMDVSTTLLDAVRAHPRLESVSEPRPLPFNADGLILPFRALERAAASH